MTCGLGSPEEGGVAAQNGINVPGIIREIPGRRQAKRVAVSAGRRSLYHLPISGIASLLAAADRARSSFSSRQAREKRNGYAELASSNSCFAASFFVIEDAFRRWLMALLRFGSLVVVDLTAAVSSIGFGKPGTRG